MSEFVVGQWVECVNDHCTNLLKKGQFYRVGQDPHYNGCGVYIEEVKALFGSKIFRPVEWQVGRTYKTTLEGVTATIAEIDSDGDFWGNDSREHKHAPKWCWSGKTGILYELKDDKTAPHLTPYLADEQPPAVETTETSKSQQTSDDVHKFDTGAVRGTDANGTRFDLISPHVLQALAETYAEGAKKYGDDNWLKGIPSKDLMNHALRHINLWQLGDTSEDHLAHAMWNLGAIIHFTKTRPELIVRQYAPQPQ